MGSQDHLDSQVYDVVMIAMTILGVVVNISAIIILQRKNQSSMFHSLLKVRSKAKTQFSDKKMTLGLVCIVDPRGFDENENICIKRKN